MTRTGQSRRQIENVTGSTDFRSIDDLSWYVVEHYLDLLTPDELAALRAFRVNAKSESINSPEHRKLLKRWAPETESSKELMSEGLADFYQKVRERVLEEHRDTVVINRCPKCGSLARTPTARQCPRCIHRW